MASSTAVATRAHTQYVKGQSYWDDLNILDRESCIDPKRSQQLSDRTAWNIKGCVSAHWNDKVYPTIQIIINDPGNNKSIFKNSRKPRVALIQLLMIGTHPLWKEARPTIVGSCSEPEYAGRLISLLQKNSLFKRMRLGFDFLAHVNRSDIRQIADSIDVETPNLPLNSLCGARIIISPPPGRVDQRWRQATLGGIFTIDNEFYGLTAAHAFFEEAELDRRRTSAADYNSHQTDDDGSEPDSQFNESSPETSSQGEIWPGEDMVSERLVYLNTTMGEEKAEFPESQDQAHIDAPATLSEDKRVGHLAVVPPHTDTSTSKSWASRRSDWALIRITNPRFHIANKVVLPTCKTIECNQIAKGDPSGKVVVAAGSSKTYEASCGGIKTGIILPGSTKMTTAWSVDKASLPGDCGSWVLDANDGGVYAMIVASSSFAQESYCIPLSTMLEDIQANGAFEVAFPSSNGVPQSVMGNGSRRLPAAPSSHGKKYEGLRNPSDEISVSSDEESVTSAGNDGETVHEIKQRDAVSLDSNRSVSENGDAAEYTPPPKRGDIQSPTDHEDWVRFGKADLMKLALDTFGDSCMHDKSSRRHILIKRSALVEVRNIIAKGRRRLQRRPKSSGHRSQGHRRAVSEIESKQDSESDGRNHTTIEERTPASAWEAGEKRGVTERSEEATKTSDFPKAVDRERPPHLPNGMIDASRAMTRHESKSDNKNDATASNENSIDEVKALLNTMQERMRTQELRVRYLELQLQDDAEREREYFSLRSARKTQLEAKFRAEMQREGYSEEQISNLVSHQQPGKRDDKRTESRATGAAGSSFHVSQISPETLDSFGIPWEHAGSGRVRVKRQISPASELKLIEETSQRIATERIGGKLLLTNFDRSALPEWMRKDPRSEGRPAHDSLNNPDPAGNVQPPIEVVNNSLLPEERAWGHDDVDQRWRYPGEDERPILMRRPANSIGPNADQERSGIGDSNPLTSRQFDDRGRARRLPEFDPAGRPSQYFGVDERPLHGSGQPTELIPLPHRLPRPRSYERPRDSSQLRPQSMMSVRFDDHDTIYPPPESIATSQSATDGRTSGPREASRPESKYTDSPKPLSPRLSITLPQGESSQRHQGIPSAEPQTPASPNSHSYYTGFNSRGSSMASTIAPRDLERELRREKQARKEAELKSDQNYNIAQELADGVRRVQTREELALVERERELSARERRVDAEERMVEAEERAWKMIAEERRAEVYERERARKMIAEDDINLSRIQASQDQTSRQRPVDVFHHAPALGERSSDARHSRPAGLRRTSHMSRQSVWDSDDDYSSRRPRSTRSRPSASSRYADRRPNTIDYGSDESLIRILDHDKDLREKEHRLLVMERDLMERERRRSGRRESMPYYPVDYERPAPLLRGYGYGHEPHPMPR